MHVANYQLLHIKYYASNNAVSAQIQIESLGVGIIAVMM